MSAKHLKPSHQLKIAENPIKLIVDYAMKNAPRRDYNNRGRPPKYKEGELAALCMVKAYLNVSFKKIAELAPFIVGSSPSKATIYRAWLRLAEWAEKALAELSEKYNLMVVDSTGLKGWGVRFKVHVVYSLECEKVVTAEVTNKNCSDSNGLKKLLKKLKGPGVILADSAYFGWNLFEACAERGLLLVAKPKKPPKGCKRRSRARKLELLFDFGRELYRRRKEGERGPCLVKRVSRWRVFYSKVESCRAYLLYFALVSAVIE